MGGGDIGATGGRVSANARKNPLAETKVKSQQTGLSRVILKRLIASGVTDAEAAARRPRLRVVTPLASTAIIHLITSYRNSG